MLAPAFTLQHFFSVVAASVGTSAATEKTVQGLLPVPGHPGMSGEKIKGRHERNFII